MENKLKCIPVMLPYPFKEQRNTDEMHGIFRYNSGDISLLAKDEAIIQAIRRFAAVPQHLYLVSDDPINRPIKEGDWVWDVVINGMIKMSKEAASHKIPQMNTRKDLWKKVEATTNLSLGLPLIPESFIKELVEKQGKIESVYISLTQYNNLVAVSHLNDPHPQGHIIILPTKDSFTYDELVKAWNAGYIRGLYQKERPTNTHVKHYPLDEWFNKTFNS